jgi:hypothetical protein
MEFCTMFLAIKKCLLVVFQLSNYNLVSLGGIVSLGGKVIKRALGQR